MKIQINPLVLKLLIYSVIAIACLMVFGDYLISKPTRLIVQSPIFYISLLGITLLPALSFSSFRMRTLASLGGVAIFAFIIWSFHQYYNGAINTAYTNEHHLACLLLCLYALTSIVMYIYYWWQVLSAYYLNTVTDSKYLITIYEINGVHKKLIQELKINNDAELVEYIFIDGFSRTLTLELKPLWNEFLAKNQNTFKATTTLYETIIKFDETQQLKSNYLIEFKRK